MSFRFLISLLAGIGLASKAFADEPRIIDVRRNIPLADSDPIYRDIYIKMEPGALKRDQIVTAVRKISVRETTGVNPLGELSIPVGTLKIIYVENNLAVARETKLLSRDTLPMLEQIGLMSGDVIEAKSK